MFELGYNTNGFAHHRLEDACEILCEIGYRSVAITVERDLLPSPGAPSVRLAASRLKSILDATRLGHTLETGSRFYLDPRRKHQPTMLSRAPAQRAARLEFLRACIELAASTGAHCVSLWSGSPDEPADPNELFARLTAGLRELLDHARPLGVRLGVEPEPGMFISTMHDFARLHDALDDPLLGLTLDVGHVHCLADGNPAEPIRPWSAKLWNVHLEDMRRGIHEHLLPGEGEMDFAPIFDAFRESRYAGPVHVELSRHSHDAVRAARRGFEFLSRF
jgi:sugar phosphate isomerase/epimerase